MTSALVSRETTVAFGASGRIEINAAAIQISHLHTYVAAGRPNRRADRNFGRPLALEQAAHSGRSKMTMKRAMVATVFVAGLVAGYFMAGYGETTVLAQKPWQCRSWEMDSKTDTSNAIAAFLGSSTNVQLTSAAVTVGSRYAVVACRN